MKRLNIYAWTLEILMLIFIIVINLLILISLIKESVIFLAISMSVILFGISYTFIKMKGKLLDSSSEYYDHSMDFDGTMGFLNLIGFLMSSIIVIFIYVITCIEYSTFTPLVFIPYIIMIYMFKLYSKFIDF